MLLAASEGTPNYQISLSGTEEYQLWSPSCDKSSRPLIRPYRQPTALESSGPATNNPPVNHQQCLDLTPGTQTVRLVATSLSQDQPRRGAKRLRMRICSSSLARCDLSYHVSNFAPADLLRRRQLMLLIGRPLLRGAFLHYVAADSVWRRRPACVAQSGADLFYKGPAISCVENRPLLLKLSVYPLYPSGLLYLLFPLDQLHSFLIFIYFPVTFLFHQKFAYRGRFQSFVYSFEASTAFVRCLARGRIILFFIFSTFQENSHLAWTDYRNAFIISDYPSPRSGILRPGRSLPRTVAEAQFQG